MSIITAGIEIRAQAQGVEQIGHLSDALDAAGVDTSELREESAALLEEWRRLEETQGLAASYRAVSAELAETGSQIQATREAARALQEQMDGEGTRRQREELARLNGVLADLRARQGNLTNQLRLTEEQMRAAGLSAENLAQEEARLAEEARRAQEESANLAAEYQRLRDLADARIELGIDTDDAVEAQIRRVTEAYERLRDSGTLTQEELEQAAQAHRDRLREIEEAARESGHSLADMAAEIGGVVSGAAGLGLLAREAVAFETAMAGVRKTAGGTDAEIAGLSERLKDLGIRLGMLPTEMAAIAEQGGQLGIALERLPEFAEMAAKMAVAFKMSAEEAGEAAATIANVYQMPMEQVEGLADAINVLGNNTAAREADIVNVMARIGGTAKQFGLAAEQAAALADAFIALGKSPEVAATAINALLNKLQTAQAQGAGFRDALAMIGLSADQLAAGLQADPQQALSAFLKQLEALDNQTRALVLTDLFGTEFADDVATLVGSLGDYEQAVLLVADRSQTAGAMTKEVATAMQTTESAVNQAKAALSGTAVTLGQALLPALTLTAKSAGGLLEGVGALAGQFPMLTQLAVLYGTVKLAVKAYDTAVALAGGNAQTSFLRSRVSLASYRASVIQTGMALRTLAAQSRAALNGTAQVGAMKAAFDTLGKGILGATQQLLAFGAAFAAGWEVGRQLREASTTVRDLGDGLAGLAAMGHSLWETGSLEQYNLHFKTTRTLEREAAAAAREAEKLRQQAAQEQERAAGLAAAHLAVLKQTAQARQQELAAAEASAKVAAAAGLAEGELHRQTVARIGMLRQELAGLQQEIRQAGAAYTFDVGPLAEAKTALKELGLTLEEVNSGIGEKAAAAVADFGKAAAAFGNDAETMQRIFSKALSKMDGEQSVAALKEKLADVGKQAGLTAQQIAEIAKTAPDAADKVAAAFEKIGVDAQAATGGIGRDAAKAFADWQSASAAAREAGVNDARLIRAGFEQVMKKLKSRQEFAAFRSQLQQSGDAAKLTAEQTARLNDAAKNGMAAMKQTAGEIQAAYEQGLLSAEEYEQALLKLKERTDDLGAAAEKSGEKAVQSHEQAARAAKMQAESLRDTGRQSEAAAAQSGGAWKRMTVNVHDYLSMTREQIQAMNLSMQQLPKLGMGLAGLGNLPEWAARVKTFKDGVSRAQAAIRQLNEATQAGTVSQSMIAQAVSATSLAFGRLDETTLSNLNGAIDAARRKLGELKEDADDTAAALEAELAGLRGDERKTAQLAQQRKLRELNVKLAEAEAQQNDEAAASYRRAISLQQQIYRERERQQDKQRQDKELPPLPEIEINVEGLAARMAQRDKQVAEKAVDTLMDALNQAVARQT